MNEINFLIYRLITQTTYEEPELKKPSQAPILEINFCSYLTGLLVRDTRNESRQAKRRSSITPDFSSLRNS